jgi:chromate transporter
MADLRVNFAGIRAPNPFWLASAPPTDKEYNVVRAFKAGLAPLLIALMFSTGWLLLPPIQADAQHAPGLLLTAASVLLMWKTRIHVLWLLAVGAVLGLLGWV